VFLYIFEIIWRNSKNIQYPVATVIYISGVVKRNEKTLQEEILRQKSSHIDSEYSKAEIDIHSSLEKLTSEYTFFCFHQTMYGVFMHFITRGQNKAKFPIKNGPFLSQFQKGNSQQQLEKKLKCFTSYKKN
jgi:hypothetical protein